ncbi:pilus assembly protein [Isoptericola sp. S6320L]|uniref:TadE family type IV pilus minor pilin n=1 Tax=Isoptericola sp. S6320L TaxID=2926411 RepID=UPI001FF19ABA|nr:TadE family type IV pilus minor pilin [Isoptericola sp. S6320L]MCK0118364.1 pilus assembly protein [Isoptericola sp. S6320L]
MSARDRGERGSVTAELAVGMPVVALLLVAVLTLAAASTAQLRAADAARAGARQAAVSGDLSAAGSAVARVAGGDAEATVTQEGDWVRVVVTRPVVGGWLAHGPLRATGEAVAWVEP